MSLTWDLEDNLINLENDIGDATQIAPQTQARNSLGIFQPIKNINMLPSSIPGGTILYTKRDQEIAAEMWLKASLDLAWKAQDKFQF